MTAVCYSEGLCKNEARCAIVYKEKRFHGILGEVLHSPTRYLMYKYWIGHKKATLDRLTRVGTPLIKLGGGSYNETFSIWEKLRAGAKLSKSSHENHSGNSRKKGRV